MHRPRESAGFLKKKIAPARLYQGEPECVCRVPLYAELPYFWLLLDSK
ncbi:MAG: hypothetical protein QOG71_2016 [Pyrinomonadaceae bacterium]|nr:hypothetical protein [Pyrinomonadaceae bacterium]